MCKGETIPDLPENEKMLPFTRVSVELRTALDDNEVQFTHYRLVAGEYQPLPNGEVDGVRELAVDEASDLLFDFLRSTVEDLAARVAGAEAVLAQHGIVRKPADQSGGDVQRA